MNPCRYIIHLLRIVFYIPQHLANTTGSSKSRIALGLYLCANSFTRLPCSDERGSLYIIALCNGVFVWSRGITVPEVEVTEIALTSFLLMLLSKFSNIPSNI